MSKKKIYKPKPISGFPEWLPEVRRAEQQWFDQIRRVFESYGFCNIETPSVEELDAINAKGGDGGADVDKEVYVLERLHKEDGDKEARLALHFDQTVPLARYTAQHFNDLVFPFKRYQMQRVWRGERPQAGRFREFYQCDIDVINVDQLPLHFDAEMPAIIWEILSNLPGMEDEKIYIQLSNRKILMGYLDSVNISDPDIQTLVMRAIDKLDKKQLPPLVAELKEELLQKEISIENAEEIIEHFMKYYDVCQTKYTTSDDLRDAIENNKYFNITNATLKEGLDELCFVLDQLQHLPQSARVADLAIVRGLDYYTGTVYETRFTDDPSYGSICSGGRYDDLAGNYINKHLPGVGISIGFSRLFDRIRNKGKLPVTGTSPAKVLIILPNEEARPLVLETAQKLRANGHNVETFHSPSKLKRQLAYAEKKGIPYVWFPPFEDGQDHEVKNMASGEQSTADVDNWEK